MKKMAIALMAAAMSFGLTGCLDDSDDCSYYGTSGGCLNPSIPYSCPGSSQCSSSPSCSNISC